MWEHATSALVLNELILLFSFATYSERDYLLQMTPNCWGPRSPDSQKQGYCMMETAYLGGPTLVYSLRKSSRSLLIILTLTVWMDQNSSDQRKEGHRWMAVLHQAQVSFQAERQWDRPWIRSSWRTICYKKEKQLLQRLHPFLTLRYKVSVGM